ncbi:hypothetical protein BB8028_0007g00220 [Beauveria bassiana]|uniref:Myb-like DNA-binding domain-containing protein n=1 Tax=Beauveria bassiana TaxID=176275 RepID=A0A2S7YKY3_BEABA|nr:hypothetical protein BB8028_0007g00220 [Beauveria bassiana]
MGDNAKGSARRVRWTKTEDAILTQLVNNYGSSQWHKVSRAMGSRNATECYNRYCNSSLALKLNPITSQEENRIRRLKKDRQSWRKIAHKFPGRTGALLKNWWWQNNKPNQRELRSHYHRNVQDVPAKEPGCDGSQFEETAARRDCPETATQREGNMEEQTANTDIGTRRNTEKQAGEPQTRESTSSTPNHLKTPTPTTRVEPQKSFSPQRGPVGYCRRRNRATALQNRGFGAKPQPLNAHNEVGAAADTKISAMAHPPANHAKIAIAKCAGKNDQVALPDGSSRWVQRAATRYGQFVPTSIPAVDMPNTHLPRHFETRRLPYPRPWNNGHRETALTLNQRNSPSGFSYCGLPRDYESAALQAKLRMRAEKKGATTCEGATYMSENLCLSDTLARTTTAYTMDRLCENGKLLGGNCKGRGKTN